MVASILPNGENVFLDDNGLPLSGGSVYFYIPGTDTQKNTWQDVNKTILNTNPVVLDSAGRAIIWGYGQYRQVVQDSLGNTIWDQITSDWGSPLDAVQGEIADLQTQVDSINNTINNITSYINTQVFNTAGDHTYTPTAGTTAISIELLAGGGGGEGVAQPGSAKVSVGSGGGGGEYIKTGLITSGIVASTVHVGAAGTAGASGHNAGGAGADSTAFGFTAKGGTGGTSSNTAVTPPVNATSVAGGTGGSGTPIITQVAGGASGTESTPAVTAAQSGHGGSPAFYGSGGVPAICGTNASTAGNAGTGYGAGGSGAVASGTGAAAAGGAGTVGQIVIYEYGAATSTIPSGAAAATQTDEEAGTLNTVYTNPLVQQFHDSAVKVAAYVNADGTLAYGYNVTSTTLIGGGHFRVTYIVPFPGTAYAAVVSADNGGSGSPAGASTLNRTVNSIDVYTFTGNTPSQSPLPFSLMCMGRQNTAPPPYVASGVVFSGSAYLYRNAALSGVSNTPYYTLSAWIHWDGVGTDSVFGHADGAQWLIPAQLTTTAGQTITNYVLLSGATAIQTHKAGVGISGAWHHILVSGNTNFSSGNKLQKMAIDGVLQTLVTDSNLGPAVSYPYTSKVSWAVGATGTSTSSGSQTVGSIFSGYMSDFQFWAGTYLDLTVPANIALFISGGIPVDPSVPAASLGTQTLLFSGNAAAFVTNQGTGGAFTVTGSLSDAPSHP